MRNIVFQTIATLWKSILDMIDHDGIEHAGYLSFLFMLAIFPFIFFFTAIIGLLGDEEISAFLINLITESAGSEFISALKPRIVEITSSPPQSFLTIALFGAVWTASSIFEALRTILNKANRVYSPPAYIWRRLLSIAEFFVAIIILFLIAFPLLLINFIPSLSNMFIHVQNSPIFEQILDPFSDTLRFTLLMIFIFFVINSLYTWLPNCKLSFFRTIPGTMTTLVGWYIASIGFKYYITQFPQVNIIYGSIAGIIIALLYFYICSIIFIVGAEFNHNLESR